MDGVRVAGIALLACGCNQIFGLQQTRLPDAAPDAVGCSASAFMGPYPVAISGNGDDPVGTLDGLELWFDRVTTHSQVFVAHRSTPDGAFDAGTTTAFDDPAYLAFDPTLTGDGLRLLFISNRGNGGTTAWEVTRASTSDPFPSQAAERASLGSALDSISISIDGTTAYFSSKMKLYAATRPRLDDSFGPPVDLGLVGENPAISPDQLELFYDTGVLGNVVRSLRASTDAAFGPPEPVLTGGFEAGLTPDSRTLYVVETSSSIIMQMTRTCP